MAEVNGTTSRTRLGQMLAQQTAESPADATPSALSAAPTAAGDASSPAGTSAVESLPGRLPVEWSVVQELREQVSADLEEIKRRHRNEAGQELGAEDERQAARAAVQQRVAAAAEGHARQAEPWSRDELLAVRTAVMDALFLAGPIQQVLQWDGVEDVVIDQQMVVDFTNRQRQVLPSPFPTEQAKVDWVKQMCAQSGARELSSAQPVVHFDLPDGSRGSATQLSPKAATVAIRTHQAQRTGIGELLRWGTLDSVLANFLVSAVKARLNILVAGGMGVGKTTLMRALGRFIPARERVATLEDALELQLDQFDDGPHVLSFQSRDSNGERDGQGNLIGEVTIADMVPMALRYRASRVMVGEVRSVEAVPMLEAMITGGSGSMCTIHCIHPDDVVERLMVPLTQAGMTDSAAYRLIASAIDLIVYIDDIDERDQTDAQGNPGQLHRYISHIQEVTGLSDGGGVATGSVFAPAAEVSSRRHGQPPQQWDPRAVLDNGLSERRMNRLVREGEFDRRWLQYRSGQWPQLQVVNPL